MTTSTCQTCRHYAPLQNQCRSNPPQAFMVIHPQNGPVFLGTWPPVKKDDHCGRHEADLRLGTH